MFFNSTFNWLQIIQSRKKESTFVFKTGAIFTSIWKHKIRKTQCVTNTTTWIVDSSSSERKTRISTNTYDPKRAKQREVSGLLMFIMSSTIKPQIELDYRNSFRHSIAKVWNDWFHLKWDDKRYKRERIKKQETGFLSRNNGDLAWTHVDVRRTLVYVC